MALSVTNLVGFGAGGAAPFVVTVPIDGIDLNGSNEQLTWTGGTPTSAQKWTVAMWLDGDTATDQYLFRVVNATYSTYIGYISGTLRVTAASRDVYYTFSLNDGIKKFIQINVDTTTGTVNNQVLAYGGTLGQAGEVSALTESSDDNFNLSGYSIMTSSASFCVGSFSGSGYYNGRMGAFCFVDGSNPATTTFATVQDGGLQPVASPAPTWGNNGFMLDFSASGDLGNDVSGNGNDFTLTNIDSSNHVDGWIS